MRAPIHVRKTNPSTKHLTTIINNNGLKHKYIVSINNTDQSDIATNSHLLNLPMDISSSSHYHKQPLDLSIKTVPQDTPQKEPLNLSLKRNKTLTTKRNANVSAYSNMYLQRDYSDLQRDLRQVPVARYLYRKNLNAYLFIDKFESIKAAANFTKISRCSISRVCRGVSNTAGGYTWKYIDGCK